MTSEIDLYSYADFDNIEFDFKNSNLKSLVFANFSNSKDIKIIFNYLENSHYALIVMQCSESFEKIIKDEFPNKIIFVNNHDWNFLRHKYLQIIYPINFSNLKLIGVTGTNGKTSVVHFLKQILLINKIDVISVGTLGVFHNQNKIDDLHMTSPDNVYNWKLIFKFMEKVTFYIFEVSSHSLIQERFFGINFDAISWTSFSQDHLDYHKTMDNYFNAKLKVLNLLKMSGRFFVCEQSKDVMCELEKSIKFKNWKENNPDNFQCVQVLDKRILKKDFMKVSFNIVNISLVKAMLNYLDVESSLSAINDLDPPVGRMNLIKFKNSYVYIDYAHTPDAVGKICHSLSELYPTLKLITVIGCGGNRDSEKRPLMAREAEEYSDLVLLTSDNPRDEDPKLIIEDMTNGIKNKEKIKCIIDRRQAIIDALDISRKSENIILIAGKGHEEYQEIKGVFYPFSDSEIVLDYIKKIEMENI
jgi:UDP-N-acetylmuramoyl-L-alanyl-D-glutamate--2,6-diaminopimelate ligase